MKKSSIYVCQLTSYEQVQIRKALSENLIDEPNINEIIDNEAMCDRLCNLEDSINIDLIIPSVLNNLCKQWEHDFKGDILEDLENSIEVYGSLKKYIVYLVNEAFPIWIDEAEECNKDLYIDYQTRFKNLLEVL